MKSRFRRFGEIMKVEDQEDGTILVYGVASSGSRDHAGEIITPDAMKAALPDYSKFPALREMHDSKAAGRVTEAEVDDDGVTNIVAHVVDPIAILKVKSQTYAGFSIGGKVVKRDPTDKSIITDIRLVEISLVDSPCNPDAVLNMWKADMTYTPTNEEVVAEAKILANAAGKKAFKDFLFKAREALIQKNLADSIEDEDEEEAAPVVEEPVAAEVDEPAAVEEPAAEAEKVDPAADLAKALEAAGAAAQPVVETVEEVQLPVQFADFSKAATALRAVTADSALAKGLYSVSRLADLMESFSYLQASLAAEAAYEGDDSAAPGKAAQIVADMGALLVSMAQEEVAEVLASLTDTSVEIVIVSDDDVIVELGNSIVDLVKADADLLEKAGKRHSKGDAEHIQQAHDHLAKLGAACDSGNCPDDGAEKADLIAENERLAKALTDAVPQVEQLAKALSERGEEIATMRTNMTDLEKRLATVEDQPAAAKTAASAHAVTKVEDVSPASDAPQPQMSAEDFHKALNELPEAQRGEILLRLALKNPQIVQPARAAA